MVSLVHHRADTGGKEKGFWVFASMAAEVNPSAQNRQHHCLTEVTGAFISGSWWGRGQEQRFSKLMILLPALGHAPVCILWEKWEEGVYAGGTLLEGSRMDDNWGSIWAFLSQYQMWMLCSSWSVAMEKLFLPCVWFLDSLGLWLVWKKKILQQIWGWFGILLAWVRIDGVSVARQWYKLNPIFVHSEYFSYSLSRNGINVAWYPLSVPSRN